MSKMTFDMKERCHVISDEWSTPKILAVAPEVQIQLEAPKGSWGGEGRRGEERRGEERRREGRGGEGRGGEGRGGEGRGGEGRGGEGRGGEGRGGEGRGGDCLHSAHCTHGPWVWCLLSWLLAHSGSSAWSNLTL